MGAVRALVQRVSRAAVRLENGEERTIGRGLLVYLGVGVSDASEAADSLAAKCLHLRIFPNAQGKFDRSVLDERAEILVVSQFTLYGDPRGGRRPDFTGAARPDQARGL